MKYAETVPPPPLDRFIECLWFVEGKTGDLLEERVAPDGCMELIFHLADPFEREASGSHGGLQPAAFLVGQLTGGITLRPSGRIDTMGVRFRPGRVGPFLGVPASELTDQFVPLDVLWTGDERRLADRLFSAGAQAARASVVYEWLRAKLVGGPAADPRVCLAVDAILTGGGRRNVSTISRITGMGRRQMERCFLTHVGIPPKMLSRIIRFQNVFRTFESCGDWAGVAVECGYYDQAHLIRDFRELAGRTPSVFMESLGDLSRRFTDGERIATLMRA